MNLATAFFRGGKKKKSRTAVLIYGKNEWNVFIFSHEKNDVIKELKNIKREKPDSIPPEIFEWILENDTFRVRVAVESELHSLTLELPEKLDMEQTHTAIAWETAELTGADSLGVRHASCRLSALGIENKKEQIITASFPTDILKNFQSECKVYGVVFEGVVSLQGVFLALHAAKQKELNESLILLCENSIFAFFPKDSRSGGVMMRNISLDSGVHQSAGDTTARFRNMLHRLEPDLSALSVYTTSLYDDNETGNSTVRNKNNERPLLKIVKRSIDLSNNPKTVSEIFFEEFPEAEEKKVKFEDIKTLFFRTVTSAEYGNLDAPCPMAVLPAAAMAKNRKADIAAAVIAGGAVLYVLTVGGFLFIKNYYLRRHNIQARRFLTKEQNLNKEKEKLKIQLEKYRKIFSLINEGKAGNQKCLEFMRDIAAVIPYGVKLDFMKYSENNIELQGSTLSQGAFSLFCSKLDKVLKDLNLKIESSSLKQNSAKKKTFELKITNRSR